MIMTSTMGPTSSRISRFPMLSISPIISTRTSEVIFIGRNTPLKDQNPSRSKFSPSLTPCQGYRGLELKTTATERKPLHTSLNSPTIMLQLSRIDCIFFFNVHCILLSCWIYTLMVLEYILCRINAPSSQSMQLGSVPISCPESSKNQLNLLLVVVKNWLTWTCKKKYRLLCMCQLEVCYEFVQKKFYLNNDDDENGNENYGI